MKKVVIVAVEYKEPEWLQTLSCIKSCNVPYILVDRGGIGSLAKAYNEGFDKIKDEEYQYVWFVSNVTFNDKMLNELIEDLEKNKYDAIHPVFDSDHLHLRDKTDFVPFLEFTAPLIKTEIFNKVRLDEDMPYWGHDLDWGYRIRKLGYKLGVYFDQKLGHTYIRNNNRKNNVTLLRLRNRKLTDKSTKNKLVSLYGDNWKEFLCWK